MNPLAIITVGGAALLLVNYLSKINSSQYKIAIVVTGAIHKISVTGVTLKVRYNIKNPTSATMKMTPPLIILSLNGKQIATSSMQLIDIPENSRDDAGRIVIPPTGETGEIASQVMIPWIALASVAPDLIARFQSADKKDKIAVKVQTNARIYTLVGSFPYEQTSIIKV